MGMCARLHIPGADRLRGDRSGVPTPADISMLSHPAKEVQTSHKAPAPPAQCSDARSSVRGATCAHNWAHAVHLGSVGAILQAVHANASSLSARARRFTMVCSCCSISMRVPWGVALPRPCLSNYASIRYVLHNRYNCACTMPWPPPLAVAGQTQHNHTRRGDRHHNHRPLPRLPSR